MDGNPQYVLDFHREHLAGLDLAGQRVLEIGSGYGELIRIMLEAHPDVGRIAGINWPPLELPDFGPKADVSGMDAGDMDFADDSFDVVCSLATFEHLPDLTAAFGEINRVLAPGGLLIAKWSPIWSGFDGHHFGPILSGPGDAPIALPWAHLMFDRESLPGYLVHGEGFTHERAEDAADRIYGSTWLNRYTVHEYRAVITQSDLVVDRLDAVRCDFGGMLTSIGAKIAGGVLNPERVARFFRSRDEEELLAYKMNARLRKPGHGSNSDVQSSPGEGRAVKNGRYRTRTCDLAGVIRFERTR